MAGIKRLLFAMTISFGLAGCTVPAEELCTAPVAVQILGSGGPIAEGHRAASSALVWIDGKAVLLVDAGSGAFVRYGESGANFADHRAIFTPIMWETCLRY
ncbi:MAG: hypothetical protein GW850_12065 [Sphingomonadales bacterium]|nr:hypothetical protein [Sphingomonadales bacterium]